MIEGKDMVTDEEEIDLDADLEEAEDDGGRVDLGDAISMDTTATDTIAEEDAIRADIEKEVEQGIIEEKKKAKTGEFSKEVARRAAIIEDYKKRYSKFRTFLKDKLDISDLELKTADGHFEDFKTAVKDTSIAFKSKLRFAVKAVQELKDIQISAQG